MIQLGAKYMHARWVTSSQQEKDVWLDIWEKGEDAGARDAKEEVEWVVMGWWTVTEGSLLTLLQVIRG